MESERIDLLSQERRLRANLQQTRADLQRAKDVIADPSKADIAKYYESDIKRWVETDIPKYETKLVSLEKRKLGLKESIVTEEKFLKLVKDLVKYIGDLQDLAQLDEILSRIHSNFVILDKSISVITFNEEWYNV